MRLLVSSMLALCFWLYGVGAAAAPKAVPSQQELNAEARRARTWRYAWSGVNAGLMVAEFAALPLDTREARPDWIISGVGSGISALATFIVPLRVESAADELGALPAGERAVRLPRLYRESAADERARVTWPWHVVNLGLSVLAGGIIAFGYDHYLSGAITAGVGTALGEAQLFTQPTNLGAAGTLGLQLVPRLSFAPRVGAQPSVWTLSLTGVL